jgi:hypothetical protein
MSKLIRFVCGTPPITGSRPPSFVALVNPHPMKYSVAGAEAVVIGALANRPEDIAALVAHLRADLDAIEAEAKKHFG